MVASKETEDLEGMRDRMILNLVTRCFINVSSLPKICEEIDKERNSKGHSGEAWEYGSGDKKLRTVWA